MNAKLSVKIMSLLVLIVLGAGCSGIQATKSFSPLDFIIPGLGMTESPNEGLTQTATPEAAPVEPSTS